MSVLDAGADIAARDDGGWTPLHSAGGFSDNPATIEALLAAGADTAARADRALPERADLA